MFRGMCVDVRASNAVELIRARDRREGGIVVREHIDEAQAIGVEIHVHALAGVGLAVGDDEGCHVAATLADVLLEAALQLRERRLGHWSVVASRSSTDAETRRARFSSVTSSSSGGMLSSRSIIVATRPKRRTARSYSRHTGSGPASSCAAVGACAPGRG